MGRFLLATALTAWAFLAVAPETRADEAAITVTDVYAQPSLAGGSNGLAYMTITNHGKTDDQLVSVTTPIAQKAEIHRMSMDGNIMKMRAVGPVTIPAGGTVTLDPDELHLMLIGLKQKLKPDDHFTLTLHFEKAGAINVTGDIIADP